MIELPPLGDEDALWHTLLDLGERVPGGWAVIGGQMTLLHVLEHGAQPVRLSRDLDLVADIRADPRALRVLADALIDLGYESAPAGVEEIAHRFTRETAVVDLLAPDNVGGRASLRTRGGTSVEVGGATFALGRAEPVAVRACGRQGRVPRPDLVGALLIKAVAARRDRRPERHLHDLAILLSLVADPARVAAGLGRKNTRHLVAVSALHDTDHEAWNLLGGSRARAIAAYRAICAVR